MGIDVKIEQFAEFEGLVSEQDIRDVIDMYYEGHHSFRIVGIDEHKTRNGSHVYNPYSGVHTITLSMRTIVRSTLNKSRIGGNRPAPDVRTATLMVLAHEIKHANQALVHRPGEKFYKEKKYTKRPCEREARQFVDEHLDELYAFTNVPDRPPMGTEVQEDKHFDAVALIVETLSETDEVMMKDIVDELRNIGENNAKNVERVTSELNDAGVRIIYGRSHTYINGTAGRDRAAEI